MYPGVELSWDLFQKVWFQAKYMNGMETDISFFKTESNFSTFFTI